MPAVRVPPSLLAVMALVAALLVLGALPAQAHTELAGTDPAEGAQLKKPPQEVALTFSQAPLATGLAVVAQGPQGRQDLTAEVQGTSVVAKWPADTVGGQYRVSYRVVAEDGHPITGQVSFSIAGSSTPTPTRSAEPATTPSASSAAAQVQPTGSGTTIPVWLWLLGAVLVVAAAYVLIARRRGSGDA